jgi:hypothetical protein
VVHGSGRLARSFSRRLSFLHDQGRAIAIVEEWLGAGGLLGDVAALNDIGRAMFENVAPVLPGRRCRPWSVPEMATRKRQSSCTHQHKSLLRSIAYDPALFERGTALLTRAATENQDTTEAKEAADVLVSLFPIYLSEHMQH